MTETVYPKIDAYNLRLFEATVREGSIARAARSENIAPSALSRRISELEDTLRTPLFMRSSKGLELTDEGRQLLQRVRMINLEINALIREAWNIPRGDEVRGLVRLWTNPSALIGYLPELIQSFVEKYPLVELQITEDDTVKVIRACLDEVADVGVAVAKDSPPGLENWHFADDALHVICPAGHPLVSAEEKVTWSKAADYPLISVRLGGALDSIIRDRSKRLVDGLKPRMTVSSVDAACRLVEVGLGIAVLPASMLKAYAGSSRFQSQPLSESWARRSLSIYAPRKKPRPIAIDLFVQHLRSADRPDNKV